MTHSAYAYVLAVVATVGIIVLSVLHDDIPAVLSALAGGGLGAGAGLAFPQAVTSVTTAPAATTTPASPPPPPAPPGA